LLGAGQGVAKEHKSIKIEANKSYTIKQLQMHFGLKTDDVWFKAFAHGMTFELIEYYRSVMRSGEKLLDEPKIIIDTIHGVKGGEADNVILLSDMTKKTYDAYIRSEADEHRVFYVGATRARHKLHVIAPSTDKFYSFQ
jgi:superfamily I DNA/RNA helicase